MPMRTPPLSRKLPPLKSRTAPTTQRLRLQTRKSRKRRLLTNLLRLPRKPAIRRYLIAFLTFVRSDAPTTIRQQHSPLQLQVLP